MKYTYSTTHHDERGRINHSNHLNPTELLSLFNKYPWKEEYSVKSNSQDPQDYDIPTIEFSEYLNEEYHIGIGMFKDDNDNELKFCILYNDKETKLITNSEASFILTLFSNKNINELEHELYQLQDRDSISKTVEMKIRNVALLILIFVFSALTIISYFEARKGLFRLLTAITTGLLFTLFYFKNKESKNLL